MSTPSPAAVTPPPKLPPKKAVPSNLKPLDASLAKKLPPPPPAASPSSTTTGMQRINSTASSVATNNSFQNQNQNQQQQQRRGGRFLRLSSANLMSSSTTTTSYKDPAASPVTNNDPSTSQQSPSTNSLTVPNPFSSATTATQADAVIASLLSKGGAFSETFRLDRSRKPVCNFKPIETARWLPDSVTSVCMSPICEVPFTLFTRRHHCRSCGLVYCSSCLKHTLNEVSTTTQTGGENNQSPPISHRVCAVCFFIHQLAICQISSFSNPGVKKNNNNNRIEDVKKKHDGAHPFTECLIRSDLTKQVRYVSTDGGSTYKHHHHHHSLNNNQQKQDEENQKTPVPNNTNKVQITPSASESVVKKLIRENDQQNESQDKKPDVENHEETEENSAEQIDQQQQKVPTSSIVPRMELYETQSSMASTLTSRAATLSLSEEEIQQNNKQKTMTSNNNRNNNNNHQERQIDNSAQIEAEIESAVKAVMPKPTYVSYWASEERLHAMQRRGKFRAFPWSLLVHIAEFLPLRETTTTSTTMMNRNNNNTNSKTEFDDATGLFSFSLVCSDFYFAARTNSVWSQFLWKLRHVGSWMEHHHNSNKPETSSSLITNNRGPQGPKNTAAAATNDQQQQQRQNTTSTFTAAAEDNLAMTSNGQQYQDRTFSVNSFESDHSNPIIGGAAANSNNNQQNNNTQTITSISASSQKLTASTFSPPFSVFAEFVTEAATHRANQLSSSGARVHKLFANGIRLTFAGDEENLKTNLVRGFALGDLSASLTPNFSGEGENNLKDKNADNMVMSPTSPDPATAASNNNNNNNNNMSIIPQTPLYQNAGISAALLTNTLGFLTYNQNVHVALAANWQQQQHQQKSFAEKGLPTTEISGVRQSFVRIYNVKSGRRHWQIARLAAKSSHACVVCYDATSRDSLTNAALYFTEVVASAVNPKTTLRVLCGIVPPQQRASTNKNYTTSTSPSFSNSNNNNIISPESALAFVGCSSSSSVVSVTVSADDPVGAVERIVQAVFARTLKGDSSSSSRRGKHHSRSFSEMDLNSNNNNGNNSNGNNGSFAGSNNGGDVRSGVDDCVLQVPTVLDILCSDGGGGVIVD